MIVFSLLIDEVVVRKMDGHHGADFVAAAIDEAQFAAKLREIDAGVAFVEQQIPDDAALEAVARATEHAGREESAARMRRRCRCRRRR